MTSAKPYLIRAIYEWIADNGYTPYIAVDTTFPHVTVPEQYIKNNTIVLDISSTSTKHLLINNEAITFKARFAGIVHDVYSPISAITAIYAAENNQGMTFPKEETQTSDALPTPQKKEKPQLKIITGGKDQTQH